VGWSIVKTRFFIIVGMAALLVIILIAAAASSTGPPKIDPTPTPPPNVTPPPQTSTVTVTIKNNIGVNRVTVTNLNTGQIYKTTMIDLPFRFTCTRGDYLRFTVTVQTGYEWNAWWFTPSETFDQRNPLTLSADGVICINNQITMTPKCLINEAGNLTFTP
jgi:hypothetical protein